MSAINVLIQSSCVHIYTDGAGYQPDGTLSIIVPKVRLLPHINAAMSMRGPAIGFAPVAEELSVASSFDGLRNGIVQCLQACVVAYEHLLSQCAAGPEFEVVVVGISEMTGPSAYLVPSHDRYGEPWSIIDLAGFSTTPASDVVCQRVREITAGRNADELDPVAYGLAVMEAQRACRFDDVVGVGGFAQLTTVDADGVHSRIIHRWDDRIGERISA